MKNDRHRATAGVDSVLVGGLNCTHLNGKYDGEPSKEGAGQTRNQGQD